MHTSLLSSSTPIRPLSWETLAHTQCITPSHPNYTAYFFLSPSSHLIPNTSSFRQTYPSTCMLACYLSSKPAQYTCTTCNNLHRQANGAHRTCSLQYGVTLRQFGSTLRFRFGSLPRQGRSGYSTYLLTCVHGRWACISVIITLLISGDWREGFP